MKNLIIATVTLLSFSAVSTLANINVDFDRKNNTLEVSSDDSKITNIYVKGINYNSVYFDDFNSENVKLKTNNLQSGVYRIIVEDENGNVKNEFFSK